MSRRKTKMPLILKILFALLAAGILCFAALVGYVALLESRVSKEVSSLGDYDAIIVLGAQVKEDGTPSIQLGLRLDAAEEAWEKHPVPVVVCGARGSNEPMPEAEAMKRELVARGVPEDSILTDPDSFNTRENLRNAKELLRGMENIGTVLIVSSDYHVPRAMALARDQGFDAVGLGSPCKAEFWIKNHFREALAWVKYWLF